MARPLGRHRGLDGLVESLVERVGRLPARLPGFAGPGLARREGEAGVAQDGPQVGLVGGEEARAELTVGGEPDAIAARAEGFGDAADHADLAEAVGVAVQAGRARSRLLGHQGEHAVDLLEDLG